jgi:hypothetical protein
MSTDGTVSHWKYTLVNVTVYRDVYREGGPGPEERLEDIRSSRCVSGSNFDRCREKGKRHPGLSITHNLASSSTLCCLIG